MNLCQVHWDKLKKAIDDRGLTPLVAKTGEEAAANLMENRNDPLMSAAMAIFSNALDTAGLGIMVPDQETGKPPCSICHLQKWCNCGKGEECKESYERWIQHAADAQVPGGKGEA